MRPILSQIFHLWATVYEAYRGLLWKIISSPSKTFSLSAHKDLQLKLTGYGYITKRIYQQQLLVPFKKSFEYETLSYLRKVTNTDFHILDIGANIGLHSMIMASELSEKGKVYSFEPSKNTYNALVENIKLNKLEGKITAFNLALSNKSEILYLAPPDGTDVKEADGDAYNSLHHTQNDKGTAEKINAITLDSWLVQENIHKIDLVKIDIEGAELLCFQGAEKLFTHFRPVVLMECYEPYCKRLNYSVMDVIMFMNKHNYKMEQFDNCQWIATPK